jgi:mono/diheme cytochrome c family protein/uncharacterized membrane protein
VKCHGADGTGSPARGRLPEIPNFANAAWQARRSNAQFLVSILDGKGPDMPSWQGKISKEQARGLVVFVRSFTRTQESSGQKMRQRRDLADFDERFLSLQKEMHELQRQSRTLSEHSSSAVPSKSEKPRQTYLDRHSARASPVSPGVRELFRTRCVKCHGTDGTGRNARDRLTEIPDFTSASWQARRNDAQLMGSILDGKGVDMPATRGKVSREQARALVAFVRSFTRATGKPGQREWDGRASIDHAGAKPPSPSVDKRQPPASTRQLAQSDPTKLQPPPAHKPSVPAAPETRATGELFRKRCVKCHAADGTGSQGRDRFDEIPDFTNASWQARRSDAELQSSILDGKGEDMPPARGKISQEQARSLVAYVRRFGPTSEEPAQHAQDGLRPPEPSEAKLPSSQLGKLIRWLGKFHPPAVHFPIALLTAAAVAEFLRMITGKREFDAITRYCVWFGTVSAIVAGALGWFRGGFRLSDTFWVTMTHRWLGTSTVAVALLALVLSELGRRPDRHWTRIWSRGALFVLAALVTMTGFFGGAIVFGLDHYRWPR